MKSQTIGSRAQVWHGTAKHTSGGLTKNDLVQNKTGHIVSKKKHNTAKKEKRLQKHGYFTKKGVFGYVTKTGKRSGKRGKSAKHGTKRSAKRSKTRSKRKMKGGYTLNPAPFKDSTPGMDTSGVKLQIEAGDTN